MAGTLLCLALVFAPWCWGCAWPAGIRSLDLMLLPATACWLGAALLRRERRPAVLSAVVSLILFQGWGMTLNAYALFAQTSHLFAPLEAPFSGWPGSVEHDLSLDAMARLSAVLGALLVAASLGRERTWRRRFAVTIIATAVSIVLLGCAEQDSGASDIFWSHARHLDYFFATFRNVTNAGEYLNIAAPMALAATWNARSPGTRAATVCALAVIVVGVCICGSKAAPFVLAILGTMFVLAKRNEFAPGLLNSPRGLVALTAAVVALSLMIWGAGIRVAQDRWDRFLAPAGAATVIDRLHVDRLCLAATGEAGWLGSGPGTFPAVFARLQDTATGVPGGRWLAAHDDYLQTELEWGALGAAAWALLFFGGMMKLARGIRRASWRSEDQTWALGFFFALAGTALMALADFPLQVASINLDVAVLAGLGWSSLAWPRVRLQNASNFSCAGRSRS
jgi:predicted membrane protein